MNKKRLIVILALGVLVCCCLALVLALATWKAGKDKQTYGALAEACYGNAVSAAAAYSQSSGIHPAAGMKQYSSDYATHNYIVPEQAVAQGVSDAQVVLCIQEDEKVLIERCPYGEEGNDEATNVVERYGYTVAYKLVEAKTGTVLDEGTLKGDKPRRCLDEEVFPNGQDTVKVEGEKVSSADWQELLRPYVIIP